MDMSAPTNLVEILKAGGSIATPLVVAVVAYIFQRRHQSFEAAMSERIKRLGVLSPLINVIFSYRQRVGDFLDREPEEILDAKREADKEFWTYEYLWSARFKERYNAFMNESFDTFRGEGKKAAIHVETKHHPKYSRTPGWVSFSEKPVDKQRNKAIYEELQKAIARDLGFGPSSSCRE